MSSYYADKVSEILNNNPVDWETLIMKCSHKKEKDGGSNISTNPGNNQQVKITPVDLETILMNYCPDNNQEVERTSSYDNKDRASIKTKSILKGRSDTLLIHHKKRASMFCIHENK